MAVAETIKPSSSRKHLAAGFRLAKGGGGAGGVLWLGSDVNPLVLVNVLRCRASLTHVKSPWSGQQPQAQALLPCVVTLRLEHEGEE